MKKKVFAVLAAFPLEVMTVRMASILMVMSLSVTAASQPESQPDRSSKQMPVIVNMAADGVVNFIYHDFVRKGTNSSVALAAIDKEVDQYQGIGVSHLFWNVNYQRVGYNSAVWPSYWDVPDPEKQVTEWPRAYYMLHKIGIDDIFARLIPRTREKGMSPWVSLRMNDHHYFNNPSRISPLLLNHPELRTNKGNGLFNYAKPEVREHYLNLIAEVLQRYDIDGVELDWIRTPNNFEANELDQGRVLLTGFVREAHKLTQAAAQRLGHPVRLAVRVPATPEFAYGKGFDTVAWAQEGLVDMIIPSDWWSGFNSDMPVEVWRDQIGPRGKNCQIVPGTAGTYSCIPKGYQMMHSLPAMRGFAAAMYDRGADGIYLFNHFHAVSDVLRLRTPEGKSSPVFTLGELLHAAGDRAAAVSQPRVHALTLHDCVPTQTDYRPALPAIIKPQQPVTLKLHTGPQPSAGRCTLSIGLAQSEDLSAAKLEVRLNGQVCRALADQPLPAKPDPKKDNPRRHVCEVAPRVLQFEVPIEAVIRGYNAIELSVLQGGPQTVVWLEAAIDPSAQQR